MIIFVLDVVAVAGIYIMTVMHATPVTRQRSLPCLDCRQFLVVTRTTDYSVLYAANPTHVCMGGLQVTDYHLAN